MRKQALVYFGELEQFTKRNAIQQGPALIRYLSLSHEGVMELEFAYMTQRVHAGEGPIRSGVLPAGSYVSARWKGPFYNLFDAEAMIDGWAARNNVAWASNSCQYGVAYDCRMMVFHVSPRHVPEEMQFETEIAVMTRGASEPATVAMPFQFGSGRASSASHLAIES
jgi:hypothetical protein